MTAFPTLPDTLFLPLAAALGLALGSFATCAGHRLAEGGSVLSPARSYCPSCSQQLTWRENIPLLGWLLLGGKCRFCRAPIPVRYPLTELLSGLFALGAGLVFGQTPHFLAAVAFATLLLVLSLIDLATYLLPDALTLPGAAAAFLCSLALPPLWTLGIGWERALAGGLLGGGGLWLVAELYRRVRGVDGMGLGDAKLLLLVGALMGPASVAITLFGGALLSLPAGILAARRGGMQARLPFGPFLCAAAACYLLGGPWLLRLWLGLPLP